MLLFTIPHNFFDIALYFGAWHHDLTPAFCAADAKIHPDPQRNKFIAAAGVRFFHLQYIAYLHVHCTTSPLMLFFLPPKAPKTSAATVTIIIIHSGLLCKLHNTFCITALGESYII